MNTPRQHCLALSLLLAALQPALAGQAPGDGYTSNVTTLPAGAGQALLTSHGAVYFTGTDLVLFGGGSVRKLLSFKGSVFGSFTIPVTGDTVLFGENSTGGIWLVPLTGTGTAKKLNTIAFNYAATMYDSQWALVSAKTGGYSAKNNDVVAIDLATGKLDAIAVVPGASGPLVALHGNIYYATASNSFPPPKGSVDILRFDAAKVASAFGTAVLGLVDAAVVFKGLDAAGAMALDDDHDAFVTDWVNGTIVEIDDVHHAAPRASVFASYPGSAPAPVSLCFVGGDHRGHGTQDFEPFQPSGGGALRIHELSFGSTSRVREVRARRATTTIDTPSPVPAGKSFNVVVGNAARGGQAFVALGAGHARREVVVPAGYEQALFWADSLLSPLLLTPVNLDGNGSGQLALYNPGIGTDLPLTIQAFFEDRARAVAGTSTPLGIVLR